MKKMFNENYMGSPPKDVCGEDNNLLYLGVCGTTKIC